MLAVAHLAKAEQAQELILALGREFLYINTWKEGREDARLRAQLLRGLVKRA